MLALSNRGVFGNKKKNDMKLTIHEQLSLTSKGTHVYTTEPVKGSAPFLHRVMSRETFSPGDNVVVNAQRGAMSVSVDDDGRPVMVWWL